MKRPRLLATPVAHFARKNDDSNNKKNPRTSLKEKLEKVVKKTSKEQREKSDEFASEDLMNMLKSKLGDNAAFPGSANSSTKFSNEKLFQQFLDLRKQVQQKKIDPKAAHEILAKEFSNVSAEERKKMKDEAFWMKVKISLVALDDPQKDLEKLKYVDVLNSFASNGKLPDDVFEDKKAEPHTPKSGEKNAKNPFENLNIDFQNIFSNLFGKKQSETEKDSKKAQKDSEKIPSLKLDEFFKNPMKAMESLFDDLVKNPVESAKRKQNQAKNNSSYNSSSHKQELLKSLDEIDQILKKPELGIEDSDKLQSQIKKIERSFKKVDFSVVQITKITLFSLEIFKVIVKISIGKLNDQDRESALRKTAEMKKIVNEIKTEAAEEDSIPEEEKFKVDFTMQNFENWNEMMEKEIQRLKDLAKRKREKGENTDQIESQIKAGETTYSKMKDYYKLKDSIFGFFTFSQKKPDQPSENKTADENKKESIEEALKNLFSSTQQQKPAPEPVDELVHFVKKIPETNGFNRQETSGKIRQIFSALEKEDLEKYVEARDLSDVLAKQLLQASGNLRVKVLRQLILYVGQISRALIDRLQIKQNPLFYRLALNLIGEVLFNKNLLRWLLAALVASLLLGSLGFVELSETAFEQLIQSGSVEAITLEASGNQIEAKVPFWKYKVTDLPSFLKRVEQLNPKLKINVISGEQQRNSRLLKYAFAIGMMGLLQLLFFTMRRNFGGARGAGTSKYKSLSKIPEVKFRDVAGMEGCKAELEELVDFLKNPQKYHKIGAKLPKGALLTGPPGVGKTHLAKAVAGEAGVPFFYISGSEFVEMYVGVGASRVRELFKSAKKVAPSIIYIDELDAVAKKRDSMLTHEELETTLNQLLVEMDGFDTSEEVIVLGSTNLKETIDPALLRPGRFDRLIEVNLPTIGEREAIFELYLAKVKLDTSARSLAYYARRMATLTPGFSGADIANICNESAILATRERKAAVDDRDLDEAIDKVVAGYVRKSVGFEEQKRRVAIHESGHAVVAWFLEGGNPLLKLTIKPRSKGALGFAQYLPSETNIYSREEMLDTIASILGGRAAESVFLGSVTTGAFDDFQKAHEMAENLVTTYGMSERLKYVRFMYDDHGARRFSDETQKLIDEEIRAILRQQFERAKQLLEDKRAVVDLLVARLMEKETINFPEINAILGQRPFKPRKNFQRFLDEVERLKDRVAAESQPDTQANSG